MGDLLHSLFCVPSASVTSQPETLCLEPTGTTEGLSQVEIRQVVDEDLGQLGIRQDVAEGLGQLGIRWDVAEGLDGGTGYTDWLGPWQAGLLMLWYAGPARLCGTGRMRVWVAGSLRLCGAGHPRLRVPDGRG